MAESALTDIIADLWPNSYIQAARRTKRYGEFVGAMLRETGAAAFIRQQHAIMGRSDSRDMLPGIEIPI